MDKLQQYFETEYLAESERRDNALQLIKLVLPLFRETFDDAICWPYEVKNNAAIEQDFSSSSTTAMVTAALYEVLNHLPWKEADINDCKDELFEKMNTAAQKLSEKTSFTSPTYGKDNIFVYAWIQEIVGKAAANEQLKTNWEKGWLASVKKRLKDVFQDIATPAEILYSEAPSPIDGRHAFPLLKALQIFNRLENKEDYRGSLGMVERHLNTTLHHYLSLASIEDSQFDAAELVFTLESLLIVRNAKMEGKNDDSISKFLCERATLDRVFAVLAEKQHSSTYWRPLTPFVTSKGGLALLPLSVEIALSLLRICALLGKIGDELFAANIQIFDRYTDWVTSKVISVRLNEKNLFGWCSEHVYSNDTIQIWETGQVLWYLSEYSQRIQKYIAEKALSCANLRAKPPKPVDKEKDEDFWKTKSYGSDRVYGTIEKTIGAGRESDEYKTASLLLYGPPGTGKTFLADRIAEHLGWPLLTLTPSNFIAAGEDMVENRANNIFQVLEEQREMVILFDEIDHLIMDRSTEWYQQQSDMFQFMTPSMLVKLKNLRESYQKVFIIGTNYRERIDPAIIRRGRIDERILVMPPDLAARTARLKETLEKLSQDTAAESISVRAEKIARQTPLATFNELSAAARCGEDELKSFEPMISLMSYESRMICESKQTPTPVEEFLMLLYARMEVIKDTGDKGGKELDKRERKFIKAWFKQEWRKNALDNDFKRLGAAMGDEIREKMQKEVLPALKKYNAIGDHIWAEMIRKGVVD